MSILKAEASQFQINDEGVIAYQKTLNNPVPGEPVAKISKGKTLMCPDVKLLDGCSEEGAQEQDIQKRLEEWFEGYLKDALEPLKKLETDEKIPAPAKAISDELISTLGVIHRSELEKHITELDEEGRKALRALRIKLGPILVFLPELNKPKAVRARALLWALWNDKALPVAVPPDGSVSIAIDPETVDRLFYRAVSYPVFGPKAIRIDMLDRVLNEIYETAQNGQFRAQHKMAEWLGCSIEDLYAILQAMGNNRIEGKKPEVEEETKSEETLEEKTESKATDEKPELDMFWLKKGQAHKKKDFKPKPQKQEKKKPAQGKNKGKKKPSGPQMISTGPAPKPEDSPFAILEQLKKQSK